MKIVVVTPTRNRLYALSLLHKYIGRQTVQPDLWIVATDGEVSNLPEEDHCLITSSEYGGSPLKSFTGNLLHGIDVAIRENADVIFFMEDDDWYAPDYLEKMLVPINDGAQIVGANYKRYFHIKEGCDEQNGTDMAASLARTGIARSQFELFRDITERMEKEGRFQIDLTFYREAHGKGVPIKIITDPSIHLGIKGMYNNKRDLSKGLTKRHIALRRDRYYRLRVLVSLFHIGNGYRKADKIYEQLCHIIGEGDAIAYLEVIRGGVPSSEFCTDRNMRNQENLS